MLSDADVPLFERCMSVGGVAVFPADTVYGLCCEPGTPDAVRRLYRLKGRRDGKPAAIMFFDRELALEALPELGGATKRLLERLLPGGITALVPNPAERFPLACGPDRRTLGIRVPALEGPLAPLAKVAWPVLQSSANTAGGPDAKQLGDVPERIRQGADLVLDAGALPGTPSTVVDLRRFDRAGEWSVVRPGAVSTEVIEQAVRET